jgi:hypothetical protein
MVCVLLMTSDYKVVSDEMKTFVLLAMAVVAGAACGHPPPPADSDARVAGQVEGEWAITWTCVACEPGQINPLAYATTLTVTATTATYDNAECGDCGTEHPGTTNAEGTCFAVEAGTDAGGVAWGAYELCSFGDALEGEITFTGYPGPPEARTYALAGTR